MKNFLIKIVSILILVLIPSITIASGWINSKLEKNYNSFINNLEKKYSWNDEIFFLKELNKKLNIIKKKKLDTNKLSLVNDLIKLNNEKIFNLEIEIKTIKNKNIIEDFPISKKFKNIIYLDENFFLENWIWYTYKYSLYLNFPKWIDITQLDLDYNKIDTNKAILFLNKDKNLWFIKDYKKIKLINDDIIFWISNKYNFLINIIDDKLSLHEDTDILFKELKSNSIFITTNLKQDEKIKKIYDYVLSNVTYSKVIDLNNSVIFSWIHTYKNKDWTCWWYSKLFSYMLSFAWIDDNEVIKWFVIDAADFPQIWHAWVKIWDKYYDPTFDDPVWLTETKKYDDYKYFSLPKDLFYTNRFDYIDTPEELKTTDLSYRKKLIKKNISYLLYKYKKSNYRLIKPFIFREENGLDPYEKITISKLKNILPYIEINDFKFIENWTKKQIKSLKYFTLKNDNESTDNEIENLLDQFNYNLKWFYISKWFNEDWTNEYRLAYNLQIH